MSVLLFFVLAAALSSPIAHSQNQQGTGTNNTSDSPPTNSKQETSPNDQAYTISLGTGQVITMGPQSADDPVLVDGLPLSRDQRSKKDEVFYGTIASTLYANSFPGLATSTLITTSFSPYIGVVVPTKTGSFVGQYEAVISPANTSNSAAGNSGTQMYHIAGLDAVGAFTGRWYWSVSTHGSYGSEEARLLAPESLTIEQGTPVVDSNSFAALLSAQNFVEDNTSLGLTWLKSRRSRITFGVHDDYTGLQGLQTQPVTLSVHSHSLGSEVDYQYAVSRRVDLLTYGETQTILGTQFTCNSVGGGLGVTARITASLTIDLSGGPQKTSAACGGQQQANFHGGLIKTFRYGSVYVLGGRSVSTGFQLQSTWNDYVSAGFSKTLYRRLSVLTDAGWLRGEAPLHIVGAGYQGYFVSPRTVYQINKSLSVSAGYRLYRSNSAGTLLNTNLSYSVASIEWHPAPLRFR
jgi:hypothetical protein